MIHSKDLKTRCQKLVLAVLQQCIYLSVSTLMGQSTNSGKNILWSLFFPSSLVQHSPADTRHPRIDYISQKPLQLAVSIQISSTPCKCLRTAARPALGSFCEIFHFFTKCRSRKMCSCFLCCSCSSEQGACLDKSRLRSGSGRHVLVSEHQRDSSGQLSTGLHLGDINFLVKSESACI